MPIGFLTAADRARLNRFPDEIPHEDLSVFFLLLEADQRAINQHHEAHTRLGFALQLCALRYLGFDEQPDRKCTLGLCVYKSVCYVDRKWPMVSHTVCRLHWAVPIKPIGVGPRQQL